MSSRSFLGKTFVVQDPDARVRRAGELGQFEVYAPGDTLPAGKKAGDIKVIPKGTKVTVSEVEVVGTTVYGLAHAAEGRKETLGWTSTRNFKGQFMSETLREVPPKGNDQTGANAAWEGGVFIGQKVLVDVVGSDLTIKQITLDSAPAFCGLVGAAARDGISLGLNSGFRTFHKQADLFAKFKRDGFPVAAKPGRSNHQHGQAFDLNTKGFDGDPTYDWMKRNAPRLGFIRTVKKEHWHWELRPQAAAKLAARGEHKAAGVSP